MAYKPTCPCLQKVADDEPIFTLRAQDITADLIVSLSPDAQQFLLNRINGGQSKEDALSDLADKLDAVFAGDDLREVTEKQKEANDCANLMRDWPTRKIAD